ncbi:asparaginase [Brevibacterium litoralis]|uniref:asparaginase n=1 Tax=Brevibacterium litoralis TaxID=3138935 RepID=UPI0032EE6B5B
MSSLDIPSLESLPTTATGTASAEIAVIERSGFVESRHLGSAVVLDPTGAPLVRVGAPEVPVYSRSCLKPLQALACLDAGAPLTGEAAVLASASHKSEAGHVAAVRGILDAAGLDASALKCPAVLPADRAFREEVVARAEVEGTEASAGAPAGASPLYFNCSGKHAAFLSACVANGWDTDDYLDPDSPLQQHVARVVERYTGAPSDHVGVDGCGAPVHAMPLDRLARGVQAVATGVTENAALLRDAILAHPWAIEGHGRPNSVAIEELGIVAKFGAEGVMVMATPAGWSVAVKCLDGSNRATTMVALHLLAGSGALDAEAVAPVLERLDVPVTGGTDAAGATAIVGRMLPGAGVVAALR